MSASSPSQTTDDKAGNKALWFGIGAILGAVGCPPVGIILAFLCWQKSRRTGRWMAFARAVSVIVALGVLVYSILFAAGRLPFTAWLIPG